MIALVYEKHPAAEQFEADLKLLFQARKEGRIRGCARLADAGSAAVRTLLDRATTDEAEVRHAAIWSVVRIGDDLQGCTEYDRVIIAGLMSSAKAHYDPFVRIGAEAAAARQSGESAAALAYKHLASHSNERREAALLLLEHLVREEPERDGDLDAVLHRAGELKAEKVRRGVANLLRVLEEIRSVHRGSTGANALLGGTLEARRAAVEMIVRDEFTAPKLLLASLSDPDRTVRRRASVKFFAYLRGGETVELPESLKLISEETGHLFTVSEGRVKANPAMLPFLKVTLETGTVVAKQRVLLLVTDLRAVVSKDEGAGLDALIRIGLRDKDREVRRYATAAARLSASGAVEVLTGRLRQHGQFESPKRLVVTIVAQTAVFAGFVAAGHGTFGFAAMMMTGTLIKIGLLLTRRRDAPPIAEDEFYETLCALEPVAEKRPRELKAALPQLRALSSRLGTRSPEVRAKARELLAKVHEATVHELPIAASGPAVEPESLPIPGSAPEPREVVAQ